MLLACSCNKNLFMMNLITYFVCGELNMARTIPSLSTDQVQAFVELARQGSLRRASEVLNLTEQGTRNRLLTLEKRMQVELYRKRQGVHATAPLTQSGRKFLPHAVPFWNVPAR